MASLSLLFPHGTGRSSCRPILAASSNGAPFSEIKKRGPVVLEIPLDQIRRPLMGIRANDPIKVKELMQSIQEIGLQEPGGQRSSQSRSSSDRDDPT